MNSYDEKTIKYDYKIIAFHLPQFHTFPENDRWWGEGFTEWNNVRKAIPLFRNHYQPRIPLNKDYYNMLEIETLNRQMQISNEYGIYGFCYYHYWFNGKKLMERPLELLLEHKEIKQRFCMCWANEPWTRSWDGRSRDVLIDQDYGDELDWKKHFDYMLPFFCDERYIKVDGRPLFLIYRSESIDKINEMLILWNELANKAGLGGLYIIEEVNSFQKKSATQIADGVLEFEPMNTLSNDRTIIERIVQKEINFVRNICDNSHLEYYNYKSVWEKIVKRAKNSLNNVYNCAFVDFDNSPRKGDKGLVFFNNSVDVFQNGMIDLLKCSRNKKGNIVFINAWNEWAEGCYLEPDEKNGYLYLEAVKNALSFVRGNVI